MRYLKTSEAAALLNVSPNTLRAWERRFGFPKPQRSEGRHRLFTHGEILALKEALQDNLSISSAISRAREGLAGDSDSLLAALAAYEIRRADEAMEAALAMRSLERAVEELLLPTLTQIRLRYGVESAAWAFTGAWASDWLRRARRMTPPASRQANILFCDATGDDLDPDVPALRALEMFCARAGFPVLTLSARGSAGLADVLLAHPPSVFVLAGDVLDNDCVARWAYAARAVLGSTPTVTFRRAMTRSALRLIDTLPDQPGPAAARIVELAGERRAHGAPGELPRRATA